MAKQVVFFAIFAPDSVISQSLVSMAKMDNQLVLIIPEGKVRDYVDGTIRNDTPEEYVRQTVEKRLVNEHKYAKERIAVEYPVQMGSGRKRADIVIFPEGKHF